MVSVPTPGGASVYSAGCYGGSGCCICGEGWRIEATNLATGVVKAVLHPISMEWQEVYSKPGQGSLMVPTRDPSADDIWPHQTGIYISRVQPDGTRRCNFGGYVETFSGTSGGATTLGLQPLDEYPFHRLLVDDDEGLAYSTPGYVDADNPGPGLSQTQIAVDLLNYAVAGSGYIPLRGVATASTQLRVRHWDPWQFKNLGEATQELVNDINGVKYQLTHQFFENPARWVTTQTFSDELNVDRGVVLRGDFEGWQYGLEVDAKDQGSRVYGVGTGEGAAQMFSVAYDVDAGLPEFQKTLAWKDVSIPATLDDYTRGAVTNYRDPASTPSMTIAGLDEVPPETLLVGDIVYPEMGYGVITYRGEQSRLSSIAWRVGVDEPVSRTLSFLPIIRPSLSVKTQVPAVEPPPTTPEQGDNPPPTTPIAPPIGPAGLVVKVNVSALNEVSGMQLVDGGVLLHNDENNTPQVRLVSLSTGSEVAGWNVSGPARVDPEWIRKHPDGRVFLGDTGDNDDNRSSRRLYEVTPGGGGAVTTISYPFGPKNVECGMFHPQTGELILVTKESAGRAVSFGNGPTYSGEGKLVASGLPSLISDGTFTNNGQFIIFISAKSSAAWVYRFSDWTQLGTIPLGVSLPKCESITIETDSSFLISTEGKKPPIYRVLIPAAYGGTN